jgi:NAD(P)H-dependent flavin oxidoreductase YrpB (nitropropane dioxygenase family)
MTPIDFPAIPEIIQGGMGVYISTPFLANAVSRNGALGTISGVAPERVMSIILGKGDIGGHYRRALSHFPFPKIAKQVLDAFYIEEGNPHGLSARNAPMFTINPSGLLIALSVCANYSFVWLAKEGHDDPVSINYLEKIAMPHVYAITGAMLAGVDFITMGAGLPFEIPAVISAISEGRPAIYRVSVAGANDKFKMSFDPEAFFGGKLPPLKKPGFLPIIASNLLARLYMRELHRGKIPEGGIHGFVVEEPTAGGHNAPPREGVAYGPSDEVDYAKIAEHGLPFWIGGSKASPERLKWAKSVGAAGIQAGSIFALCEESGMDPMIRRKIRELGFAGKLDIRTDMKASPTGFPFKVAVLPETLSEESVYLARKRVCDHGALRTLFEEPDGSIGYRCPAEPVAAYLAKQGALEDTSGARCICNGLLSTCGFGHVGEAPIVTLGDDVSFLRSLMARPEDSYGAVEALKYLLAGWDAVGTYLLKSKMLSERI